MAFSATGNGGNSGIPSAQQSINLPTNVLSGSSTIPPSGLISSGGLEQLQQQPHNQLVSHIEFYRYIEYIEFEYLKHFFTFYF